MPSGAAGGAGGIGVGGLGMTSATMASSGAAYNPFGDSATAGAVPVQKNLFQQNQPQVRLSNDDDLQALLELLKNCIVKEATFIFRFRPSIN